MLYSTSALNSIQDCDTIISNATSEKSSLEFRRSSLLYRQSNSANNSAELQADLIGVTTQLNALTLQIASMPEGPAKDKALVDQAQLTYQQMALNLKITNKGPVAAINLESDLADVESMIIERDVLIAAATARKTELGG